MRAIVATLAVAVPILGIGVATAVAAPTEVHVRVEGRTETLFEGPISTDGHNIRAASDTKAPKAGRRCNGLNNNQNPTPGPTPTAAAVDAMSILGEGFDGQWYAEPFEDYFIKRWGPDGQDEGKGEYWGVAVNNVFTGVGGCQYLLDQGDEVLWAYDSFSGRPRLSLYPSSYSAGALPLTASVQLGLPFEVEVEGRDGAGEGTPPPAPQRAGAEPFEGAEVAPVVTGPGGFELADVDDPDTVVTDADGLAEIEFDQPGWHRVKATVTGVAKESVVRSNRLDVCVYALLPSECPPLSADDLVRTPPPAEPEGEEPEAPGGGTPSGAGESGGSGSEPAATPTSAVAAARGIRLRARLDRSRLSLGQVKVSWFLLDAGAGIAKWTIASQGLGRKGTRYVTRASGREASSATLRLPLGATYRLRLTVTDVHGRASVFPLGQVQVGR